MPSRNCNTWYNLFSDIRLIISTAFSFITVIVSILYPLITFGSGLPSKFIIIPPRHFYNKFSFMRRTYISIAHRFLWTLPGRMRVTCCTLSIRCYPVLPYHIFHKIWTKQHTQVLYVDANFRFRNRRQNTPLRSQETSLWILRTTGQQAFYYVL